MIKGIIRTDGSLMLKEDVLREAALTGHVDGYPLLVLVKIFDERKNPYPSASTISSGSWRQIVLAAIVPHYVVPRDRMALVRGSLIHAGFKEFSGVDNIKLIREKRYRFVIPGMVNRFLTGAIDLYFPQFLRLEDWKSCSKLPELIRPSHVMQLAIYYWLLIWGKHKVMDVCINYITWRDCIQLRLAKMETGETANVIGHELFQTERLFLDRIQLGWEVLQAGFDNYEVPSMMDCNTQYCRYCSVKWVCDAINEWGDIIDPRNYRQEDYL